jgi:hypothetical protein
MLRLTKALNLTFVDTNNMDYNSEDGLWLNARLKNQTESLSDIWIPNMLCIQSEMLSTLPQDNNNNPLFNMQNILKLSTYHAIKELQSLRTDYSEFLFINSLSGYQLSDYEYSHLIKQAFKKMRVPDMYEPYTLKHTAITKLVKLGVELSIINKSCRYALNSTTALKYYIMNANTRTIAILAIKESKEIIFQEFQSLSQIPQTPLKEEEKD